jgi:hypothetical protein
MAGYLIDAGAAELISQEAAWATTLLLGRVGIACARHALTLWAVARPRCRGCHVARHATEACDKTVSLLKTVSLRRTLLHILEKTIGRTVAAGVDTRDGELGGVARHRTALQCDLAVHGGLVARQDQA